MIRFQPITTSDVQHYKFMEELLVESFPPEEYRELEHLREYTDRIGNFHNYILGFRRILLRRTLRYQSGIAQRRLRKTHIRAFM